MRIALVHEFLTQMGGAERVLENFLNIWPDATLHLIIYNKDRTRGIFEPYKKRLSFLDKWPGAKIDHKLYLAFMPKAIESFRFEDYDVVFSDSSSFAKGAMAANKLHICYCHTPTRFLWTEAEDYLKSQPYSEVLKFFAKPTLKWLRKWDYKAAQRPNFFIANSENVRERIKKYYGRDAEVIYPPVDTEFFQPQSEKKDYFLVASRLEPYKKVELVVEAFNELGWPLKVAGSGTRADKLKAMAKSNVEFVGHVTDEQLRDLYGGAKAFVFPAEEDAGIMLLESQSCGTPVIAYGKGGALELVKDGETGILFGEQSASAIKSALLKFRTENFNAKVVRENALKYDKKIFRDKIRQFVETKVAEVARYHS
jgi:glycosyltransferase involved in cell wall biosynthesis